MTEHLDKILAEHLDKITQPAIMPEASSLPATPALAAVAAAVHQEQVGKDPAPSSVDVYREQLKSIVRNATATAREHHRVMREMHDGIMRALDERGTTLEQEIDEYCQLVEGTIVNGEVIQSSFGELHKRIATSPLPRTIAGKPQRNGGGKP